MIKGRLVVFIYGANLSADETVTSWISTFTRISSFIQGIVQASQCSEVPSETGPLRFSLNSQAASISVTALTCTGISAVASFFGHRASA